MMHFVFVCFRWVRNDLLLTWLCLHNMAYNYHSCAFIAVIIVNRCQSHIVIGFAILCFAAISCYSCVQNSGCVSEPLIQFTVYI